MTSKKPEVTPDWQQILYTPERVSKWMKGEMTLKDLTAYNGAEMLQMAVIGFRMYEQGRYSDAKTIFQGLVTLDPNESYYLTALGAVHLAEDELEDAERLFSRSIKLNPKELASLVNRGEVYLRLGKVNEAAQDFSDAVKLDPQNKDPLTHRARLLAAAVLETIESAQKGEAKPKAAKDKKK
jgi:Flp pilus assembly protein TadD